MIDKSSRAIKKGCEKEMKILKLSKNMPECLRNKSKIDLMSLRQENKELRNS